jgi:hypothetical protein
MLSHHQQIVRLFCDIEAAIKTIIGIKTDLLFLFCYYTVLSSKLAMVTGHAMLINLHHLNNANH